MRFFKIFLILALLLCPIIGSAQYFKVALDPSNADPLPSIMIIPASANTLMTDGTSQVATLVTGDSVGVFNASGVCYGSAKWVTGSSLGITIYGKSATPAPDSGGFADNEVFYLKIKHGGVVYTSVKVIYASSFLSTDGTTLVTSYTDGKYHANSFYYVVSIGIQKSVTITGYLHGMYNATTGVHALNAVSLELRYNAGTTTTLPTSTLLSRKAAIMNSNGTVTVDFGDVVDGNYWVVLRAAGYLPLGTTVKITLSGTTPATYNFTDASTKVAGAGNAVLQLGTPASGPWYARAGDLNGDCAILSPTDYTAYFKKSLGRNVASFYPALTTLTNDVLILPSKNVAITLKLHGLAGTTHKQVAATVELRDGSLKGNLISVRPGLIDANGVLTIDFGGVADGNYYICVRAAGYLPCGSTSAITLSSTSTATYNFTDASSKAAGGTNDLIQQVVPGPWYVRAGEFNFDAAILSPTDYTLLFKKSLGRNIAPQVPAP